jgi:Holliday junction DNA helicase RuvA
MISRLRGNLLSSTPVCVVDVGGVGFELLVTERDRGSLAQAVGEVSFFTYTYVREDRLSLFGFLKAEDRELFVRLIEVSGIGPRIALGIMSEQSAENIVRAIRGEDNAFLCRLPGLGKKTAERLIMELKDKLRDVEVEAGEGEIAPALREEAILALTSLGMTRMAVQQLLARIDWTDSDMTSVEAIVREALRNARTS